ncbi:MAG: HDOD domain-containing protein [Candidatus Hydrogenedentes bacterium]|nr:HDOD domain-containing protein [Candidatus Hydrogenedentota bacterium]
MNTRETILTQVRAVPGLPVATTEIVRMLEDPDVEIGSVVRAIEHDPGLTSNVLRMSNSAYFAGPRSIGSVRDAIVRLGLNRVFQLALAASVAPMAGAPLKGYDLSAGDLLDHSIAVALGAEKLAQALGLRPPPYTFTAALLHDLGKVILGTFIEIDAKPIIALAFEHQVSFETAEEQVLGINHAEVGAVILEQWNLPAPVVDVVRWHHQPDQHQGETLALDLIHIADSLATLSGIGAGKDGLNYRPSKESVTRLHITTRVNEEVVSHMLVELEELRNVFALVSGRKVQ